jgi:hypothetical protein
MFFKQVIDIADQVGLQVLFILSEHALGPLRLIVVCSGTYIIIYDQFCPLFFSVDSYPLILIGK